MDNSQWVQSRRDMISQYYVLPPEAQQQAEQVFQKMEQIAAHCTDQGMFEQQMAQSPVSQEFNALMASFGQYAKVNGQSMDQAVKEMRQEQAASAVQGHIETMVEQEVHTQIVRALPDEVNAIRSRGILRSIPVVGSIVQWFDNFNYLRRLFGMGRKDNNQQQQM